MRNSKSYKYRNYEPIPRNEYTANSWEFEIRNNKSHKYKNYGSIPRNEYSADNSEYSANNTEKNIRSAADSEYTMYTNEQIDKQLSLKRLAHRLTGSKRSSGWIRSWKANGWRAESASNEDEFMDV